MSELPKIIYFNPLSITESNLDRDGAYQIYARTHQYKGDAVYMLCNGSSKRAALTKIEFIELWNNSESITEISKLTGLKNASLSSRASDYRQKGFTMKYFVGGPITA